MAIGKLLRNKIQVWPHEIWEGGDSQKWDDKSLLKSRIYTVRGVKVMLDADLAEIYGYTTKAFNRQVKNNIDRFAEDFRFQLSKSEVDELRSKILTAIIGANDTENLRCKNCTANLSTMSRSCPFVFTEQGI